MRDASRGREMLTIIIDDKFPRLHASRFGQRDFAHEQSQNRNCFDGARMGGRTRGLPRLAAVLPRGGTDEVAAFT